MEKEIIFTKNLTKKYKDVCALNDVSLIFNSGIMGLIGPNGSGKTTLIKILMGFIKPSMGEAYVLGFNSWKDSNKIAKLVGYMPELLSYPRHVSCRDYLKFVARVKGVDDIDKQVGFWLKFVGLNEHVNREIGSLSMGMRRRFSLACALIGSPELLILDEPTANLDIDGRMIILEKIMELHKDFNLNIFLSSHIIAEIERVCDHIAILISGCLIECSQINELYSKYGSLFKKFVIMGVDEKFIEELVKLDFLKKIEKLKDDEILVVVDDENEFYAWIKENYENYLKYIHKKEGGDLESLIKIIFGRGFHEGKKRNH